MPKQRKWSDKDLAIAVGNSKSYRAVLIALDLIPAGGNYQQIKRHTEKLGISTTHFTGKGWNKGLSFNPKPAKSLDLLLVEGSEVQSYKLKAKLFRAGLKEAKCELCGWCEISVDGRIPLELDHINGVHSDNRIENLRILCPNCHSLQPTHRGKNKRVRYRIV